MYAVRAVTIYLHRVSPDKDFINKIICGNFGVLDF